MGKSKWVEGEEFLHTAGSPIGYLYSATIVTYASYPYQYSYSPFSSTKIDFKGKS
jgi:hypothetical protein